AAGTGVQVDRHPPLMALVVGLLLEQGEVLRFLLEHAERAGPGFLLFWRAKLGDRRLADERPALHAAVILGYGERLRPSEPGDRDAAVESGRFGRSDLEGVEPHVRAHPSGALTTVAEREGHHA